MHFHLNGLNPGSPEISEPAERYDAAQALETIPEEVDVLIAGCVIERVRTMSANGEPVAGHAIDAVLRENPEVGNYNQTI